MAEVTIEGERMVFPAMCPVCQMPARNLYQYRKESYNLPGLSQSMVFLIAYCDQHARQLVQADRRLRWIALAVLFGVAISWALVAYIAIIIYPPLKIVPGDTLTAWSFSLVVVMCLIGLVPVFAGVSLLADAAIPILFDVVPRLFESVETKTIRRAIAVKNFDMPIPLRGRGRLRRVTFSVINHEYAHELHTMNPGSKLTV